MNALRDLFNTPAERILGETPVLAYKLQFDQFDDALTVGLWFAKLDLQNFSVQTLAEIRQGTPERAALERTLAGCLALAPVPGAVDGQAPAPQRLHPDDLAGMPLPMVAEALAIVLEVNMDFFFRTLPRLATTARAMGSIGSALLSSLSALGTAPSTPAATR